MDERSFRWFFAVVCALATVVVAGAASDRAAPASPGGGGVVDVAGLPGTAAPGTTLAAPDTTAAGPVTTEAPATTAAPAPFVPTDDRLVLFGDSVLLGVELGLPGALAGWDVEVDAAVSRFSAQMADHVERAAAGVGQVAVVQVGNNYAEGRAAFAERLGRTLRALDHVERVVLLTVAEVRADRAEVNAEVRAAAARHPRVVLADWAALAAADPSLTARDGLHLRRSGADAMLALISRAVGPPPAAD